jgi:hypothetical protein
MKQNETKMKHKHLKLRDVDTELALLRALHAAPRANDVPNVHLDVRSVRSQSSLLCLCEFTQVRIGNYVDIRRDHIEVR